MQRFFAELHARLARQVAEEQNKYSPGETARRVQTGHWINWPLYITQPVIPVLFFFLHFADVLFFILVVLTINVIWIRIVSQTFVSLLLSRLGDSIALLKWVASPVAALMLWHQGHLLAALAALSWPVLLANILFALHRFWPDGALANTQEKFRAAANGKRVSKPPPRKHSHGSQLEKSIRVDE